MSRLSYLAHKEIPPPSWPQVGALILTLATMSGIGGNVVAKYQSPEVSSNQGQGQNSNNPGAPSFRVIQSDELQEISARLAALEKSVNALVTQVAVIDDRQRRRGREER